MKTFVMLLTLSLVASASIVSAANSAVPPRSLNKGTARVSFAGTWNTISSGKYQYTVVLKQTGNKVTGSFSPGNGKISEGVVTENKLTFKWTQDGGYEGIAVFTMNEDGKGFTGRSSVLKPTEFTVSWNTFIPPEISFAGTWETISDDKESISLNLLQNGATVTGVYPGNNGKLEGTISGKVLRFKWKSDRGTGSGRFVMDESARAFSGTYNRGDNPDEVEATWNGNRPVSFAGVWKVVMISTSMAMNLQQSGNQVTGEIESGKADVPSAPIREGVVVGNTLRFKLGRVTDTTFESIEVVMDKGGKSFKGHIGDAFVTGSFQKVTLPAHFAGAWQATFGESTMMLILLQNGSQVVGRLNVNSADFGVIDGIVDGNTVLFKIMRGNLKKARPNALPEYVGTGELVLDADGKSFKGTILGTATSGTFIGP